MSRKGRKVWHKPEDIAKGIARYYESTLSWDGVAKETGISTGTLTGNLHYIRHYVIGNDVGARTVLLSQELEKLLGPGWSEIIFKNYNGDMQVTKKTPAPKNPNRRDEWREERKKEEVVTIRGDFVGKFGQADQRIEQVRELMVEGATELMDAYEKLKEENAGLKRQVKELSDQANSGRYGGIIDKLADRANIVFGG